MFVWLGCGQESLGTYDARYVGKITTDRQELYMTLQKNRGVGQGLVLSIAVVVTLLLSTPTFAFEREGTVIFFSLEDLQLDLRHLFQRDTLLSIVPQISWQTLRTQRYGKDGPIERSWHWGNGQGVDGYLCPGMPHPLWGY